MPAAKTPAATKRTTPRRAVDPNVVDFDAARKKKGNKKKSSGVMVAFGREWPLKVPNQALVGELLERDSTDSALAYIISHIKPIPVMVEGKPETGRFGEPTGRTAVDEFKAAVLAEEDFDEGDLTLLMEQVTEGAYKGIPT